MVLLKLLEKSVEKIAERQVKKAGITFGDIWRDQDLAAALPAVRAGDLAKARELLDIDDPPRADLRLHVLSDACLPHLSALEDRYGDDDPLLLLLGGTTRLKASWEARGSGWASGVGEDRFRRFFELLEPAVRPLTRAAELAPEDPRPWNNLQWYGLGMQVRREELDRVWLELCARDSWHHRGRYSRLQVLCEKWQGSHEEMFAFARENASLSGPGDACLGLLPAAHKEHIMLLISGSDEFQTYGDVKGFVEAYLSDPGIRGELTQAADQWLAGDVTSDPEHANVAHLFGAFLYYAGDIERAARALAHAGRVIPETSLWGHVSAWPASDYRDALKKCGLLDGPSS
ncbi:hypothetical protein [Nocardiopsis lambiniae]|uniref:Tetratricopeptide repeat protein n=1 Tax=Nocardiopsis lambiniae TaxID=3075539 RepID=A0ABU2MH05_9ACTN|nr:hypothetical protein [Nocardiopsis sp. DSM 44743]MDT0331988.1 hypothetical protein [Nocardiopsis sp. DSM 44743]